MQRHAFKPRFAGIECVSFSSLPPPVSSDLCRLLRQESLGTKRYGHGRRSRDGLGSKFYGKTVFSSGSKRG